MSFQQFNVNNSLTSVDLASTDNIVANYFNGPTDNGVGATLSSTSTSLSIDSITLEINTSVLLKNQTNSNENGIYVCIETGGVNGTILQRRSDYQCIEQINSGQYLTVSNGVDNIGQLFVLINPLPNHFGKDAFNFVSASEKDFSISLATSFPGNVVGISSTISDSFPVNQAGASLESIKGIIIANGFLFGGDINCLSAQFFSGTGTYNSSVGSISGVKALMSFTGVADINFGVDICGLRSVFQDLGNVTNNSGLHGIGSYSVGTVTSNLFSHYHAQGKADNLISIGGDTTGYYLAAGASPGSAGDVTKCNATRVLKFYTGVGTVFGYIPVFTQNT